MSKTMPGKTRTGGKVMIHDKRSFTESFSKDSARSKPVFNIDGPQEFATFRSGSLARIHVIG